MYFIVEIYSSQVIVIKTDELLSHESVTLADFGDWFYLDFLVFNATFSNISAMSWRPVLVWLDCRGNVECVSNQGAELDYHSNNCMKVSS
jgi:hypothetical protein